MNVGFIKRQVNYLQRRVFWFLQTAADRLETKQTYRKQSLNCSEICVQQ